MKTLNVNIGKLVNAGVGEVNGKKVIMIDPSTCYQDQGGNYHLQFFVNDSQDTYNNGEKFYIKQRFGKDSPHAESASKSCGSIKERQQANAQGGYPASNGPIPSPQVDTKNDLPF